MGKWYIRLSKSVIGSFWYVKNWLSVGNPLGYLEISLGSWLIYTGNRTLVDYNRTTLWSIFDVTNRADWQVLRNQLWKQYAYPLVVFLGSAVVLPVGLWRQKWRLPPGGYTQLIVLLSVTALSGLLYLRTPFTGDTLVGTNEWQVTGWIGQAMRFAFPFITMLTILAAQSIQYLDVPAWIIEILGALLIGATIILNGVLAPLLLGLLIFVVWQLFARFEAMAARLTNRPPLRLALLVVGLTAAAFLFQEIDKRREAARGEMFNEITLFVDHELDANSRLAYMFNLTSYPLYGSDLKGDIIFLDGVQMERLETLQAQLAEESISLLAVGPIRLRDRGLPQANWFDDESLFQPVFGREVLSETVIFRVQP